MSRCLARRGNHASGARLPSPTLGETKCIEGEVIRVNIGPKGVHFLHFCEDQMACPFTVVIFSHDLNDVGDVRRLAGRMIEIKGPVKLYGGRPEIILRRISQIEGGAAMIPALPKTMTSRTKATSVPAASIPARNRQRPRPLRTIRRCMETLRIPTRRRNVPHFRPCRLKRRACRRLTAESVEVFTPFPCATLPADISFLATQFHRSTASTPSIGATCR